MKRLYAGQIKTVLCKMSANLLTCCLCFWETPAITLQKIFSFLLSHTHTPSVLNANSDLL